MDLNRTAVVLDWVGWWLMLSPLWSWVYEQIRPRLQNAIKRTERRMKALGKLVKHRYGPHFEKLEITKRVWAYNKQLGFDSYMSLWMRLFILIKRRRIRKRLTKYGLASDEDRKVWQQEKVDRHNARALNRRFLFEVTRLFLQTLTLRIADRLKDILQGKPATVLFAVGFVMWNASKVISLWVL